MRMGFGRRDAAQPAPMPGCRMNQPAPTVTRPRIQAGRKVGFETQAGPATAPPQSGQDPDQSWRASCNCEGITHSALQILREFTDSVCIPAACRFKQKFCFLDRPRKGQPWHFPRCQKPLSDGPVIFNPGCGIQSPGAFEIDQPVGKLAQSRILKGTGQAGSRRPGQILEFLHPTS